MTSRVIQCQFCEQPMQVPALRDGQSISCPTCHRAQSLPELMRDNGRKRRWKARSRTMPCPNCNEQFGITDDMLGRAVICPFCKNQIAVSDQPRESWKVLETQTAPDVVVEEPVTFEVADSAGEPATEADGQGAEQASTVETPDVDKVLLEQWLPPKFMMGSDERFAVPSQKSRALNINTNITRIHFSDQRIPVRTITREEKDRRRRIRVLLVCSMSAIALIVIFRLLLRS